ncbi:MAG: DUF4124 domain-containing protein [Burkholderiales bacterium]|nr:DUF4124 domain-containing protein [Burkholderiales bacterium]
MIEGLKPALPLLAVALLAGPAFAQLQYKSIMSDGRVVYGDAPVPGAAKVEKLKASTADQGITASTPREAAALKQMEAERAVRERKDASAASADEALRRAEAALAAGKEPLPGERIGTAGGGSRLTDAYWERQKRLAAAVEQARRNAESARGAPAQPPFGASPPPASGQGFDAFKK